MKLFVAVALVVAGLAFAAPVLAGTYTVSACSDGFGTGQNHLFTPIGSLQGGCSSGYGLWSEPRIPLAGGSNTGWLMRAPAGTLITSFSLGYFTEWTGDGYGSQVDADGFAAGPCFPGLTCGWLPSQPLYQSYGWTDLARTGVSSGLLQLISYCRTGGGCPSGWVHSYFSNIEVGLTDPSSPAVAFTSGQPAAGEWVRGTRTLGYSASDNSGIRRTRLRIDGVLKSDDVRSCDYAWAIPCSSVAGSYAVDTTQLTDGARTVEVEARDATDSNSKSASVLLPVDNHAPVAPEVTVDGGESARATPEWTVRWTNPPAQAAPITRAHWRVCRSDGNGCSTGSASATGSITGSFGIAQPGDYTIELWLEDAAGNADASRTSSAVHLRFDDGAPGAAAPREPERRWLGGVEATTYRVAIAMAPGATLPASGIAGYGVTTDGTTPGTSVTAPGATAEYGPPPGGWPDGTVVVRARAISGAGVPSAEVGQTVLHVDRLAPATSAEGQGGDWQPGPVVVRLMARDEPGGSGMGAADDGEPVEAGGHLAYTLDAGALKEVAGDEAEVVVAGNGTHAITLRAYDVAGNVSADRVLTVRVGDPLDAPAAALSGFWASSRNPRTTFAAAAGFGSSCPALATLTPSRDAYVDQGQPDSAFGHGTALLVRSGAAVNARALLGFAMPAAQGCSLLSARLRLSSATGAGAVEAIRLGSSWDEEVTWRSRPGSTGAAAVARDGGGGWLEFDVTEQVRAMYRGADDGLVVREVTEGTTPPAGLSFGSREGVPAERAQLVVSFG
jgi:hypothetical protein